MRILLNVLATFLLLTGGVWFLQGINAIPGSFMTGQTKWAIIGGALIVASISLFVVANRRDAGSTPSQ
jgi:hypothetical protein